LTLGLAALGVGRLSAAPAVILETVATDLRNPVFVGNAGDSLGRLFAVEQRGVIKILDLEEGDEHSTLLDSRDQVDQRTEHGMRGIAFHPGYDGVNERRFYVNYSAEIGNNASESRLSMFRTRADNPNRAESTESVLLTLPQPSLVHDSGTLLFGPEPPGTNLYIGFGDGGPQGDPDRQGQNSETLFGAILRIDVDGGFPYGIPTDNPFAEPGDPGADEILVMGVRNPWRFTIDAQTDSLLFVDVGEVDEEEINIVRLSALWSNTRRNNAGWSIFEGTRCFRPLEGCDPPEDFIAPHTVLSHVDICATIGGPVYRGSAIPTLAGHFLFADHCGGEILSLAPIGHGAWSTTPTPLGEISTELSLASFGTDAEGEVYVCDRVEGEILKILPDPNAIPAGAGVTLH
jgi:glucose/arabinose dehydrogenase